MKLFQKLTGEGFAKGAARFMKDVCYFVMGFAVLCLILAVLGRQTFIFYGNGETCDRAIYAEEDHTLRSRAMTVSSKDEVRVLANSQGGIDLSTHIGLSVMMAANLLPMIAAYWLLSRVFANVQKGRIFIEQNAVYLFYYGVLQFLTALIAPFFKLLVCGVTNLVSDSQISISTGQDMLQTMIPSIAFLVAAYIIHYGIHLQDEVDHTL